MIVNSKSTNIKRMFLFILFFCLTIILPGTPTFPVPENSGFSIEQVLGSPFPSYLTADTNGSQFSWIFNINGIENIWIAKGPDFKSKKLTHFNTDDGQHLRIHGFINLNKYLLFSKGSSFNPTQDPKWKNESTLYITSCSKKKEEKPKAIAKTAEIIINPKKNLTAFVKDGELYIFSPGKKPEKVMTLRGKLTSIQWCPQGSKLAMKCIRGKHPYQYSYITLYDHKNDKVTFLDASIYYDHQPCWSPDGKKVAFLRRLTHGHKGLITSRTFPKPDPWEIRISDLTTGKTIRAWKSQDSDNFEKARISWLDNYNLVFLSEADGWAHLYTVPSFGGTAKRLTKGTFEVESFEADPILKTVFFSSNAHDADRRHIWKVGLNSPMEPVTKGQCLEWKPVISGNKKYLGFFGSSATEPAQVFVKPLNKNKINIKNKTIKLAAHTMPQNFPKDLVTPLQVIFKSSDGLEIHGQLFLPPSLSKSSNSRNSQKNQRKYPAIMYFHGGPIRQMLLGFHYSSYYHKAYAMNQYLASTGYVVLAVNYRLGIGYGRAFRDVPDGGPRGASEYRDLLAGAKFLRNLDSVNPNKIGLWGGSYGGLMTALGLSRNSDLFAAGVDLHGVHDWNQWQAWITQSDNKNNRTVWKSSPLADLGSWRSPVLLIHGDDDRNVPFSETQWLAEKLIKQGVDIELLIFPDDVHSFLLHKNWVKAFKATASFFDRKLKK